MLYIGSVALASGPISFPNPVGNVISAQCRAGRTLARTVDSVNIAVAAAGQTVNAELMNLLSGFTSFPAIGEGVAASAGTDTTQLHDSTNNPVLGFLIRPEEVFQCWLVTPMFLSVFELATNGESLLISVPWSRVARLVQSGDTTRTLLNFEIDADRSLLVGELVEGQLNGALRPAGYAVVAENEADRLSLTRLAGLMRRQLR